MTFDLPFPVVLAVATALWLCLIAACAFVFRWSCASASRYFWRATIVAVLAAAISYWATTHVSVTWSETLDGQLRWRIDSRWFFMASLGLAISALLFTLLKRLRLPNVA
jgi:hypothetical protein